MSDELLHTLHASTTRLRELTEPMSQADLTRSAYPTQWNIAAVLSHLGSGAVITQRRLDDALASRDTPDDFAPQVWHVWNAKDPVAQRDDALAADAALVDRLDATTPTQRRDFTSAMGPLTLGFHQFVGMRLNEHALHTWDIEVVLDPTATLPPEAATLIVDNLELIARFTGRPTGDTTKIHIATTGSARAFTIDLAPESVDFAPAEPSASADLELPVEAFVRLVYGRLDPEHTPGEHGRVLDVLRPVFPGP